MRQLQIAFLLSLCSVAALALAGRRPYLEEFRGRWRQSVAVVLLVVILALAVLYPVTSFGVIMEIDPSTLWFPSLFAGHALLVGFLLAWWALRTDIHLGDFLHLSRVGLAEKIRHGVAVGCRGWLLTVLVTMTLGSLLTTVGGASSPGEAPEFVVWLIELPLLSKLTIVAVAMTVEEAFFRAFLQSRFGLLASSLLFALSHFSYGLPFMIAGVFTISLVIGYTFRRGGDLLPCIVAHGVFDAIQLLIVLPWAVRMWTAANG
jgi:membrane protease YdiL (CAAX protease family)